MATIDEAKERYVIKAEKNGINDNLTTDNYRFCLNFNESQNKFLTLHLQNRGVDDIRYIQKFLVLDKELSLKDKKENKANFEVPTDYFDFSSARAKAKKDNCSDYLELIEFHIEDLNEKLYNEYTKPSFEYRESICTVNSDLLSVYLDDFEVEKVLLNYYRYPNQIGLVDADDPESPFNAAKTIEWDDKSLDDIISIMVMNYDINQNSPRYQLQTLRTQK